MSRVKMGNGERMGVMKSRKNKLVEWLLIIICLPMCLFFLIVTLMATVTIMGYAHYEQHEVIVAWLDRNKQSLMIGNTLLGVLILYWMFWCGGVKSKLWRWLPPFVVVRTIYDDPFWRWILGVWMGAGCITGGIGVLIGIID